MTFTKEQIKELEWFCKNCTGTRQEYYKLLDQFIAFKSKLDRLNETSKLVLKYMKKNNMAPQYKLDELLSED